MNSDLFEGNLLARVKLLIQLGDRQDILLPAGLSLPYKACQASLDVRNIRILRRRRLHVLHWANNRRPLLVRAPKQAAAPVASLINDFLVFLVIRPEERNGVLQRDCLLKTVIDLVLIALLKL